MDDTDNDDESWGVARITCSQCGVYEQMLREPKQRLEDHFKHQGWDFENGGKARCPDCIHKAQCEQCRKKG